MLILLLLIGLFAGYLVVIATGAVNFGSVGKAAWFAFPMPLKYGLEFNAAAIIGMCLISIVSAIETVGDISAIAKGGAGREATDKELAGGTYADGLGSALAGVFGGACVLLILAVIALAVAGETPSRVANATLPALGTNLR